MSATMSDATLLEKIARLETKLAALKADRERWRSPVASFCRELRQGVARARRRGDRSLPVTVSVPAYRALVIAERLEATEGRMVASAKFDAQLRNILAVVEDGMRDALLRYNYAATDLEILLQQFIGRPAMTMQEVREQRSLQESRPSSGPQPFIRKSNRYEPTDSLLKSLRSNRVGFPREPGEEG